MTTMILKKNSVTSVGLGTLKSIHNTEELGGCEECGRDENASVTAYKLTVCL